MAGSSESDFAAGPGVKLALAAAALAAAALIAAAPFAAVEWGHAAFWNDLRLSRVIAFARGYDVYSATGEGPLTGLIYGPLGFWTLAPAALFSTPTAAAVCAVLLTIALWMTPAALLLRRADGPAWLRLAALLLAPLHLYWTASAATLWNIHVDGPALFWAGMCVWFTVRAGEAERGGWNLAAAAFCAASAAWSKQTLAPVLLAPAAWMFVLGRRGEAARALAATVAFGAAWGALFGAIYGYEDLFFTMFRRPALHPRYPGLILVEHGRVGEAFDLFALAAVWALAWAAGRPERRWFEALPRPAMLALALCGALLPTAILGRIKADGASNNFFAVDYFLTLGVCFAVASMRPGELPSSRLRGAFRVVIVAVLALQAARAGAYAANRAYSRWFEPLERPAETAFRWALERPGEAYFPWNPTGDLLANGRLDHAGYALETWRLAGQPISAERFRAHTPPGMRYIIGPPVPLPDYSPVLPEFRQQVELPGMERWRVLARE